MNFEDTAKIMNKKTKAIQLFSTSVDANNYCRNNKDWVLVL